MLKMFASAETSLGDIDSSSQEDFPQPTVQEIAAYSARLTDVADSALESETENAHSPAKKAGEPTLKTPISAETLDRLSPEAREVLADFEANIDTKEKHDIGSLHCATDFDRLWVPLIAFRIFSTRIMHYWNIVAADPRFPNFRKVNISDMITLSVTDSRPAEAVIEIIHDFAPSGYNTDWILEVFGDQIRTDFHAWNSGHVAE